MLLKIWKFYNRYILRSQIELDLSSDTYNQGNTIRGKVIIHNHKSSNLIVNSLNVKLILNITRDLDSDDEDTLEYYEEDFNYDGSLTTSTHIIGEIDNKDSHIIEPYSSKNYFLDFELPVNINITIPNNFEYSILAHANVGNRFINYNLNDTTDINIELSDELVIIDEMIENRLGFKFIERYYDDEYKRENWLSTVWLEEKFKYTNIILSAKNSINNIILRIYQDDSHMYNAKTIELSKREIKESPDKVFHDIQSIVQDILL